MDDRGMRDRYDRGGEPGTMYEPGAGDADSLPPVPRSGPRGIGGYGSVGGRQLDITGIVRRTFAAVGDEAASLAGIGLLVYSPAWIAVVIVMLRVAGGVDSPATAQAFLDVGLGVFNTIFIQLASGGAVVLIFARFRGRRVSIGEAVRSALSRFFSLIWLAILVGFSVGVGLLLCIVPGFILQAALGLAVPALMVEELRASQAWSRSFELTRGHRWPIFVIQIFFVIIGGILAFGEIAALNHLLADTETYVLAYLPISLATTMVLGVLNAVAMVLVYHDLRLANEGLDEDSLVAAFE